MAVDVYLFSIVMDMGVKLPSSNDIESFESDDDFYQNITTIATNLGLVLIQTIDPYGVTLINKQQLEPLEKEIQVMRSQPHVNHKILDILQQAVDKARELSCYILFCGD